MQRKSNRMGIWNNDVHRFIAPSEFTRKKLAQGGLPLDRIVVKPNFVTDPGEPYSESRRRQDALFVGRLSTEKGVSVLLEAWEAFPDIPLTVLGDGPERERLESSAPKNVHFLGNVDAGTVRVHMRRANCLIFPSIGYETFGLVAVEAFANGLPVVASRIGSLAEIVQDGVNGVHFEAGKPDDLIRKLRELFAAPERLEMMGREARRTYERLYTPEVNLRQLEKIYTDAIELSRSLRR
jgi:glycosyltransferase involved in cell wall biosynthesis